MPFEGTLRGRVYDAQDQIVGEAPIQAQPDNEGEMGGPGAFEGTVPFHVDEDGPGRVEIAEISARDGSIVVSATVALTLVPTPSPTPTTPPRDITLTAPEEGATVNSPVEVRGRVTVMPFEGTLRGRVYNAQGQVVGEAPIQARADAEGEMGGPGAYSGIIPFQAETSGPGRVEIAELSARDGSLVVSAAVRVTLASYEPPDLSQMDVREEWTSPSIGGIWIARGLAAFPREGQEEHSSRYYQRLTIARSDGSRDWTVVDRWSALALGYTTPQPLRWSSDGRFFYFTNRPVPDGCAVFVNGSDLQRVDVADGIVTELVPAVGLWLSLSPNETMLAYAGYGDRGLVLQDLSEGSERQTQIEAAAETPDAHLGHVVWSPDGTALMLTVAFNACGPAEERTHALVRVDAETLSQTTVIPRDDRLFTTLAWPQTDRVALLDQDDSAWDLDPWTGNLVRR
jgi:hypothetical protein